MTTVKELRRDVEIVRRALAPREEYTINGMTLEEFLAPMIELERIEKEYLETHTKVEWTHCQHDLAKAVAADYAATRDACEKVFDPVTRGYVFRRKVKRESIH